MHRTVNVSIFRLYISGGSKTSMHRASYAVGRGNSRDWG